MKATTMKLLLVYPQQASKPGRRVSRVGAQLQAIAATTREILDKCANANLQIHEFAYDYDINNKALIAEPSLETLCTAFDDTDLVIDISPAANTNIATNGFSGPVLHLSPAFGGSFVCNDISVKGLGRLLQSDVVRCLDDMQVSKRFVLPSTHELDAQMHYAAFTALPTRVGDAFYRNEKEHALIFLSYPEHLRNEETINSDTQTLCETLHTVEELRSITFVCESLEDLPLIQQVADELRQALGLEPSIWGLRKGEYQDMYSIMAKSDVVLCGGSSLYADAIILGIPVYPWRTEQAGTEPIAQTYIDNTADRSTLLKLQRTQLDNLVDALYLDGTIGNYRPHFEKMLCDLLNQLLVDKASAEDSEAERVMLQRPDAGAHPLWVIAPARMSNQRNVPDRLSRSLWNDRQKLLQFRQPANREIVRRNDRADRQVFTKLGS